MLNPATMSYDVAPALKYILQRTYNVYLLLRLAPVFLCCQFHSLLAVYNHYLMNLLLFLPHSSLEQVV